MPHETALVALVAAGLGLAFVFGMLAARLRLPPLVGYLVAGIVVGPFSPGFVADTTLASQLAEIGVILLMFGVGMHFSVRDLLAVRRIAVPGAIAQIVLATALGAVAAHTWGWDWSTASVFGLSLSVASTVVLLRALEERGILDSMDGRIGVGWLIVEDLAMVLVLVLLPALAPALGGRSPAGTQAPATNLLIALEITIAKVAVFVALMLFVGSRVVPWLLARVARTGSRELFTLSVLAVALGIAFEAAILFGVSFALGAFFAGVVVSESDLSHQAAADALPLQDAFAVLFFVSVGMLFDPMIVVRQPLHVLVTTLIILFGKAIASFGIVLLFRYPVRTALTVSASLGQIGEFSFILAGLGRSLGLMSQEGQSLILAGAILSIALNPLMFSAISPVEHWLYRHPKVLDALERRKREPIIEPKADEEGLRGHAVIVGFGRVGSTIGRAFEQAGVSYLIVERDRELVESLRARGHSVLFGDAGRPGILEHAHVEHARLLVVASPGAFQTREILTRARKLNPTIDTVARTHSEGEQRYLEQAGIGLAVMGERELALGMTRYALGGWHTEPDEVEQIVTRIRSVEGTA